MSGGDAAGAEGVKAGAIVLAAGAGSRFGGRKLLAPLAGRPVLQHVLDALADAGLHEVVVVLGTDAADIEAAVAWRSERRVRNPRPADGLSSSLRIGLAALAADPSLEVALIALGDQPLLQPAALRTMLDAAGTSGRPVLVPAWAGDGSRNPVLVARAAWSLAEEATGDRGLGPVLAAHPELVLAVPLEGDNPDIDGPADLEAAARRLAGEAPVAR